MHRRYFIKNSSVLSLASLIDPVGLTTISKVQKLSHLKFGICADIHLDTVYDGKLRLETFINEMKRSRPDFIIQMGDFCSPYEKNIEFLKIWNQFEGPKYHVIGNHDTDGGFLKSQVVSFLKMPHSYYSFDVKGFHFIVLDANDPYKDPQEKYWAFIGKEQFAWLEADLAKTKLPIIVFIHQGLDNDSMDGGVENAVRVRGLFDRHNTSMTHKVLMVFSGHHHADYYNVINGIHYVQINSMSYKWLGKEYEHEVYTEEVNLIYPMTKYTAPYKDPLWAQVEIDSSGVISIKGKESQFVGKTPIELGRSKYLLGYPEVPYISDRKVKIKMT